MGITTTNRIINALRIRKKIIKSTTKELMSIRPGKHSSKFANDYNRALQEIDKVIAREATLLKFKQGYFGIAPKNINLVINDSKLKQYVEDEIARIYEKHGIFNKNITIADIKKYLSVTH